MRNRIILIIQILFFVQVASAQSLDDFIQMAVEHHPQLQAESSRRNALATREGQISAWQDPTFSVGYNVTSNSMEKATVSLMQSFSWFGTASKQKDVAKLAVRSSDYGVLALREQISIDVSNLYYELQELSQLIDLYKKNVEIYKDFEDLATHKLSTAKGNLVDVVRAEIAKDNMSIQIELLEQKEKSLEYALNRLVNRDIDMNVILQPQVYTAGIFESNAEVHPEMLAMDLKIQEMEAQSIAIKSESMPSIGIGTEYMRMNPSHNEFMPMVSVSLPIFRKKYKAKVDEAQFMKQSYTQDRAWLLNQFSREKNGVRNQLIQADKELSLYTAQIDKVKKAKEILVTYYSTAGQDFEEILRLQQEEFGYEQTLIQTHTQALKLVQQWMYLNYEAQ